MMGFWSRKIGLAFLICIFLQVSSGQQECTEANPGRDFTKIKGPSKNDRIAIVGAGPAGVHMAYILKKAGYRKVSVFERNPYIGGMSRTIYHKRVPHELGTVFALPDFKEIYDLIKDFDAGDILNTPQPTMHVVEKNQSIISNIRFSFYNEIQKVKPNATKFERKKYYEKLIDDYCCLHNKLFGNYSGGDFMKRPSKATLAKINMSFLEFLQKNGLEVLQEIFERTFVLPGYGPINETAAYYGLTWMTPNYLRKEMDFGDNVAKVLSKGFQFVWTELQRQMNLNITLSSDVTRIRRYDKSILIRYNFHGRRRKERFDFLILSGPMKSFENIIRFKPEEKSLFDKTEHYYLSTTLIETANSRNRGKSPLDFYIENVKGLRYNTVWARRESYPLQKQFVGTSYSMGGKPSSPEGVADNKRASVYTQFSHEKPTKRVLENVLREYINQTEEAQVLEEFEPVTYIWPFFPRYSVSDINSGVLWDIFEKQGKHKTWYIGSSVSFESVLSVIKYNNLLLKEFSKPAV